MDWFLYDNRFRHERVKDLTRSSNIRTKFIFLSEKKRKDICLLFIFTNDLNHKF